MPSHNEQWTIAELLQLLQDLTLPSRKLVLKGGQTTVQRVWHDDKPCIEKQYFGALLPNQQREADFLFVTSRLPQILPHIAPLHTTKHHQSIAQQSFYTEWVGLDLEQWHTVLGKNHPMMNSVPGMLYLVSNILQACFEFHDLGLVHNDLHWGNIVLNFRYDRVRHEVQLLPDQIRLIDFEFSLRPSQAKLGIEPRTTTAWMDANGKPIRLSPTQHSDLVCAAEIAEVFDDKGNLVRRYKEDANGRCLMKPQPFAALSNVDFGVDFFTLAHSIDCMIDLATTLAYWDDAHIRQWNEAHNYLLDLPRQLRQYDALPNERAEALGQAPHQAMIRQIQHHIGRWRVPSLLVRLPGEPQAAPTRRTFMSMAAWGAGACMITGGIWLAVRESQNRAVPPKPLAPAELNMRVRLQGEPSHVMQIKSGRDGMRLDLPSGERSATFGTDGIARFDSLPGSQLRQKVTVNLDSDWYEAVEESPTKKASIELVDGEAKLAVRVKRKTLRGKVFELLTNGHAKPFANVKITVADGSKNGQFTYTNDDGLFKLDLRADLDGGKVFFNTEGFGEKSQFFYFGSNDMTEQFLTSERLK